MERLRELEARIAELENNETPSAARVELVNELGWELVPVNIVRAASLGRESLELARQLGYEKGVGHALLIRASHEFFKAEYGAALDTSSEARSLFERLGDRNGEARILLMEGLVRWSTGDYESAMGALYRCLELSRQDGLRELEGWALTSLGGVFDALGDRIKAIGLHAHAFGVFSERGYAVGQGRALNGLGSVYYQQGRLDAALEQHLESLELFRSVPSELSEARALNDMGVIYRELGEYDRALGCLNEAVRIRRAFGNRPAVITTVLHLGELHLAMGAVDSAVRRLEEAALLAAEARARPKLHQAYQALSRAHEAGGDYREALWYQRRSQRLEEEVLSDEAATRLKNLQIRYEVEKAEHEAEIQRLRNIELADALAKLQKAQAQLVQSEKMASLGRLVAGVAHEMSSPVGVILANMELASALVGKLGSGESDDMLDAIRENLDTAAEAGRRLREIVETLKVFSRVDRSTFERFDLHEGIESTLKLLAPQWGDRVRIVKRFGKLAPIEGYPQPLHHALMTLLSNAADAVEEGGTITVATEPGDDFIRITVTDDGCGIPKEQLERLFDVGFTRKGSRMRMHTGLANVHATVVELHGGSIDVESREGVGTSFVITLPVAPRSSNELRSSGGSPEAAGVTASR